MAEEVFRKELKDTDIRFRFSFPTEKLEDFDIPEVQLFKYVDVVDFNGSNRVWRFKCSKRDRQKNIYPYDKPVLSSGWIKFAKEKELGVKDQVIFYKEENDVGNQIFKIRAQKRKKVFRLFGLDIYQMVDV